MWPTPGDVHVNRPLTNISVAFVQSQDAFIATKVFPIIPVQKQSDAYWSYDIAPWTLDEMKIRAPGTESEGSGWTINASNTYYCSVWALHHDIPDVVRANADEPLDLERDTVIFVTQKALIRREKYWASKFFTTGVWATEYTGIPSGNPGTGQFLRWDNANSVPIYDIKTAKRAILERTGFEPNVLVLGRAVADALTEHVTFVDRVKYGQTPGQPAKVNLDALAALLEVDRVYVMKAIETTSKLGASTRTSAFIGGKHALLAYVPPAPGIMTPSAGYTFAWTGHVGAGPDGQRIKRFRMENLAADRIEIEMAFDMKVISADLGAFFNSAVS